MNYTETQDQQAFRKRVRHFIEARLTDDLRVELEEHPRNGPGPLMWQLFREMGEEGMLAVSWPKEYGGGGKPPSYTYILTDESERNEIALPVVSLQMVGPTFMQVGSDAQKREYLPRIMRGEMEFALGYTEPNSGSDLASLQTRAVRDGDDYVINGQKIYTTHAHYATHLWLAVRTDPDAPKHRGISLLIVPMDSPGISVRPLWTMSDERTNEVFLDDVRVPVGNRVGEENQGWYYMAMALDHERSSSTVASPIERVFDDIVQCARSIELNGKPLTNDPYFRMKLAEMATRIHVSRLFSEKLVWMIDAGLVPNAEASMTKVWFTETRQLLYQLGTEILGAYGQLAPGSPLAPLGGKIEQLYRDGPRRRFTAGTNEIQRNIIAQRGLGLPR